MNDNSITSSTVPAAHSAFKPDLRALGWSLSFIGVTALIPKQSASNHQFRKRMRPTCRMPSSSSPSSPTTTSTTSCLSP